MKYYLFDYQTKYHIGEIDIPEPIKQYDPRIPGNAVFIPPPTVEEGKIVKWNGYGWDIVDIPPPTVEEGKIVKWNGYGWDIVDIPREIEPESQQLTRQEQIELVIRPIRDMKLRVLQNRIDRFNNQVAGGIPTTETAEKIMEIYRVMQQLRDFPATVIDPWNPVWPDENL